MACAEEIRLRQTYKAALRAWNLSRSSLMNGVHSIETSLPVRKKLLSTRLKAASDLYEHALACPTCRTTKIHLIDDD
jgi:hypothetical protein